MTTDLQNDVSLVECRNLDQQVRWLCNSSRGRHTLIVSASPGMVEMSNKCGAGTTSLCNASNRKANRMDPCAFYVLLEAEIYVVGKFCFRRQLDPLRK